MIRANLDRVRALCEGSVVADHERIWAKHQTLADPQHLAAARLLRRGRVERLQPLTQTEVALRSLTDYDTALGITAPGRRGGLMATATKASATSRDLAAELIFLTRALNAPTLPDSAGRLAERARAESWSHEEYLAACLQRKVAARDAHGGEGRMKAARFPARKGLEEFDFDHARGLKRDLIAHLGTLDFVAGKENVIFLGRPGTGNPFGDRASHPGLPSRTPGAVRHRQPMGRPARRSPHRRPAAS